MAKLNYDELLTAVTEVESIINSRPLSYITSEDLEEPITPSHFLTGRRLLSFPDRLCHQQHDPDDEDYVVTHEHFTRRLKHLNTVLNQFWKKWHQEYLLELREAHRYGKKGTAISPISVGSIVLVHDERPRGFWRLAKVNQLLTGKDGLVRGAVVKGKDKFTELQRPLQLLYPLEVDQFVSQPDEAQQDAEEKRVEDTNTETGVSCNESNKDASGVPGRRMPRTAANKAREKFQSWNSDGRV